MIVFIVILYSFYTGNMAVPRVKKCAQGDLRRSHSNYPEHTFKLSVSVYCTEAALPQSLAKTLNQLY